MKLLLNGTTPIVEQTKNIKTKYKNTFLEISAHLGRTDSEVSSTSCLRNVKIVNPLTIKGEIISSWNALDSFRRPRAKIINPLKIEKINIGVSSFFRKNTAKIITVIEIIMPYHMKNPEINGISLANGVKNSKYSEADTLNI